jgi:hypothetical protein
MTLKENCCTGVTAPPMGAYRRVLWVVLVINFAMFSVEMSAGVWGNSVALQADALDSLGDSATYIITLAVLGMSLRWRAGAAMLKGLAMTGFGLRALGRRGDGLSFGSRYGAGFRRHVVNRVVGLGRQCDFGRVVVSPPGWRHQYALGVAVQPQ